MNPAASREVFLFEHRFWLQVMGDHARFIYGALAPMEEADIRTAGMLIEVFVIEAPACDPTKPRTKA